MQAALALIEAMTLRPAELTAADIEAVRAAGVSDEGIDHAIQVGALFNIIDRLADAFEFYVPDEAAFRRAARVLLRLGYKLPPPIRWLTSG